MRVPLSLLLVAITALPAAAQKTEASNGSTDTAQDQAGLVLRVFLDCAQCDFNNIRQDISFVNYVRDQSDADVHVLVTTQDTASRGRVPQDGGFLNAGKVDDALSRSPLSGCGRTRRVACSSGRGAAARPP